MILAAVVAPLSLGAAAIEVEEIGSFHVADRPIEQIYYSTLGA